LTLALSLLLHHGPAPLLGSLKALTLHHGATALLTAHILASALLRILVLFTSLAGHIRATALLTAHHGPLTFALLLLGFILLSFGGLFILLIFGGLFILFHLEGAAAFCVRLHVAAHLLAIRLLFVCSFYGLMALSHCAGKRRCAGE
jgi:hypothetical protein